MKRKLINITPISDTHRKINLLLESLDFVEQHFLVESFSLNDFYQQALSFYSNSVLIFSDLKSCAKFILDNNTEIQQKNIRLILILDEVLSPEAEQKFSKYGLSLYLSSSETIKNNVLKIESLLTQIVSDFKVTINIKSETIQTNNIVKMQRSSATKTTPPADEVETVNISLVKNIIEQLKNENTKENLQELPAEINTHFNQDLTFLISYNHLVNLYYKNNIDTYSFFEKTIHTISENFDCELAAKTKIGNFSIRSSSLLDDFINETLQDEKKYKMALKGQWKKNFYVKTFESKNKNIIALKFSQAPEQKLIASLLSIMQTVEFVFKELQDAKITKKSSPGKIINIYNAVVNFIKKIIN